MTIVPVQSPRWVGGQVRWREYVRGLFVTHLFSDGLIIPPKAINLPIVLGNELPVWQMADRSVSGDRAVRRNQPYGAVFAFLFFFFHSFTISPLCLRLAVGSVGNFPTFSCEKNGSCLSYKFASIATRLRADVV